MSDGMYEVFAKQNRQKAPKTIEVNKYVHVKVFRDRVLIVNEKAGDQICLKKTTFKKLYGMLYK